MVKKPIKPRRDLFLVGGRLAFGRHVARMRFGLVTL